MVVGESSARSSQHGRARTYLSSVESDTVPHPRDRPGDSRLPCILSRFTPLSRNCSQNVFFTTLSVSSRSHGRGRKKEAFANTCRAAHDWSVTSTINTQQAPDEACAHNAHMADLTTTAWPRLKWVIEHALTRPPTLHPTTAH